MRELISRKERIVFSAVDVMNELGVHALSTKRVAAIQQISESAIFKYFPNKLDLLNAVLDIYRRYDRDIFSSIHILNLKGSQGIGYFFDTFSANYESYPALTAITQGLGELRYIEGLRTSVDEILTYRQSGLIQLIEEAKDLEEIAPSLDSILVADILLGSMNAIIGRWRLDPQGFSLKQRCTTMKDMVLFHFKS